MSGKKYTDGFVINTEPYDGRSNHEALYNLDGNYKALTFTVGHIDKTDNNSATLNIYLDGTIAYTTELKYDELARKITIPLNGALHMKIELIETKHSNADWGFSEGKFE